MASLIAFPFDWTVKDGFRITKGGVPTCEVRCFAFDTQNKPILLRFPNAPVHAYLQLPKQEWSAETIARLVQHLKNTVSTIKPWGRKRDEEDEDEEEDQGPAYQLRCATLVRKNLLHFYDPKSWDVPMLLCEFNTVAAAKALKRLLDRYPTQLGITGLALHETDLDVVRRLLTLQRVKHTGWFTVSNALAITDAKWASLRARYRADQSMREWVIEDWRTLHPCPSERCPPFQPSPTIAVFDFEMWSSLNQFPAKTRAKDCIFIASLVVWTTRKANETLRVYCFYLGQIACEPGETIEGAPPGTPIHKIGCRDEKDLLCKFQETIAKENPDLLSGYNIEGFDLPWFAYRVGFPNAMSIQNFGRIEKEPVKMSDRLKEMTKKGGMGTFHDQRMTVPGRVIFDLLPYIQRNNAFRNFKLETVCQELLQTGKLDMPAKTMFEIYGRNRALVQPGRAGPDVDRAKQDLNTVVNYCIIDSLLVMRLIEQLNVWVELCEFSSIMGVPVSQLYSRGQQIRVFSKIADTAHHAGYVIDKQQWEIIQAAGATVQPPIQGVHDHVNVLDFASLYPSIIMGYNLCFTTLIPKTRHKDIAPKDCNLFDIRQMEAVNPDHAAEHISMDFDADGALKDGPDEESEEGSLPEVQVENPTPGLLNSAGLSKIEVTEVRKGKKADTEMHVVRRDIRFIRAETKKGLLPLILEELVGERNKVRKIEQKKWPKGSFEWECLEKRQLALKITANALYGFLGCQTNGILPCPYAFICVTARGRELIKTIRDTLEAQPHTRIVFGDTDSLGFSNGLVGQACYDYGVALAKQTGTMFPPPIRMEFEKMTRIIVFKKKMYAYLSYQENGVDFVLSKLTGRPAITLKGVRSARRDNCAFQVDLYNDVLEKTLHLQPVSTMIGEAAEVVGRFVAGQVPLTDLAINTRCGIYASDSQSLMKTLSETMLLLGKPITPGDRVDWIVREPRDGEGTQVGPRALTLEWVLDQDEGQRPPIDQAYYLGKIQKTVSILPVFGVRAWMGENPKRIKVVESTLLITGRTKPVIVETLADPMAFLLRALELYRGANAPAMLTRLARWMAQRLDTETGGSWDGGLGETIRSVNAFFVRRVGA